MKTVWVLAFLAVGAVVVVTFQAIKQEISIRRMRNQIVLNTQDVKIKEDEILVFKEEMQKLNNQLVPLDKQRLELIKKMDSLVKEKEIAEQTLNTCQTQLNEAEQQKSQSASVIDFLQTNQNVETQTMQEEIQRLHNQVVERDAKICLYVDREREETKTWCMSIMPGNKL